MKYDIVKNSLMFKVVIFFSWLCFLWIIIPCHMVFKITYVLPDIVFKWLSRVSGIFYYYENNNFNFIPFQDFSEKLEYNHSSPLNGNQFLNKEFLGILINIADKEKHFLSFDLSHNIKNKNAYIDNFYSISNFNEIMSFFDLCYKNKIFIKKKHREKIVEIAKIKYKNTFIGKSKYKWVNTHSNNILKFETIKEKEMLENLLSKQELNVSRERRKVL